MCRDPKEAQHDKNPDHKIAVGLLNLLRVIGQIFKDEAQKGMVDMMADYQCEPNQQTVVVYEGSCQAQAYRGVYNRLKTTLKVCNYLFASPIFLLH